MANSAMRISERIETVFLDRDGVLNKKMPEGRYVTSWEEFEPLPGVVNAIRALNEAGIRVIVVTNQRGVALGYISSTGVAAIHATFQEFLKASNAHIDTFYVCPHDKHVCNCRKPKTGLFEQAMQDFPAIKPETSVMMGDSLSDMEAARNFGIAAVLIAGDAENRGPGREKAQELADASFASLPEAVDAIIP